MVLGQTLEILTMHQESLNKHGNTNQGDACSQFQNDGIYLARDRLI